MLGNTTLRNVARTSFGKRLNPRRPGGSLALLQCVSLLGAALAWGCGGEDDGDVEQSDGDVEQSDGDVEQSASAARPEQRRATWAVSPQDYNETFPGGVVPPPPPLVLENQSLRQIMHTSVGGANARVRLSNLFGTAPLSLAGAHIAHAGEASAINPASDTELSFNGQTSVSIPVGQEIWSDPSALEVAPGQDLAITLFVAGQAPVTTVHAVAQQTAFLTPGDALSAPSFTTPETRTSYYWVTGIDVTGAGAGGVIVSFGDSITDGVGSTLDANHRYPNYLADRVRADPRLSAYGVINEGISGNRVLNDVAGPGALTRFERDVLGQSGASHLIILIGINDLGFSGLVPEQAASALDVTRGLETLITRAKSKGLDVYLATLLPLQGTMAPYYGERTEAERAAINAWIRSEADVDGVIDFDRTVQNAADPLAMDPNYDSGDHLHPNDAGYQVMADSIDLGAFR